MSTLKRLVTAAKLLLLALALTLQCAPTSLEYTWNKSGGQGSYVWFGGGSFGYCSYCSITSRDSETRQLDHPLGWSFTTRYHESPGLFGLEGCTPQTGVGIFGVRVCWAPVWPITLVAIAAVAIPWTRRTLREQARRLERGECLNCGYSLRGLTSKRCPECGTAVGLRDEYARSE